MSSCLQGSYKVCVNFFLCMCLHVIMDIWGGEGGEQKPSLSSTQWRSQDITVARAQHGHTTFVRTSTRSAEAYRGIWRHPPPPPPPEKLGILQPPRSVLRPYTVAKCKSLTAKSHMMSV